MSATKPRVIKSRGAPSSIDDIEGLRAALQSNTEAFHNGNNSAINIVVTIRRTNAVLQEYIDEYSTPYGLSAARSQALLALFSAKDHTMPAYLLAELLNNTRGNVTALVHALVKAGLVTTKQAPHDKRSTLLTLSVRGLSCLRAYAPQHYAALDQAIELLSDAEQKTLLDLLDSIRSRVNTINKNARALKPKS